MEKIGKKDKDAIVKVLNTILEGELAGVVRYTHYSLLVYGFGRIPIISWLKSNASESMIHAQRAGEMVTLLGYHPSLKIGPLLESHKHQIKDILEESMDHEKNVLESYYELEKLCHDKVIFLEEYARELIQMEEMHLDEVDKMLRNPGEIECFEIDK